MGGDGTETFAGYFQGDVEVLGTLSKSSGSFKIDDPLDPANKYLYHSFVESPDMKNIYNGNVVTDGSGTATVTMPAWFEALNTDFRYQLTTIGQPAQAWIASEIANGSFHRQDQQAGREGFLAGDRHPSGRLGQRASHPGGSGQGATGPGSLPPSRAVRARGPAEHRGNTSSPARSARARAIVGRIVRPELDII